LLLERKENATLAKRSTEWKLGKSAVKLLANRRGSAHLGGNG